MKIATKNTFTNVIKENITLSMYREKYNKPNYETSEEGCDKECLDKTIGKVLQAPENSEDNWWVSDRYFDEHYTIIKEIQEK